MKVKFFNCRGARWNEIRESSLGAEYLTIYRTPTVSQMRRYGSLATAIDIHPSEIPVRRLAEFLGCDLDDLR